jgi:hypothetical protein
MRSEKMTVGKLIEELKKDPPEAEVRAYEGEATGITIMQGELQIGFIETK